MGGNLSCVKASKGEEEDKQQGPRTHQYEEIDDNFVIRDNPEGEGGGGEGAAAGGEGDLAQKRLHSDTHHSNGASDQRNKSCEILSSPSDVNAMYQNVVITPGPPTNEIHPVSRNHAQPPQIIPVNNNNTQSKDVTSTKAKAITPGNRSRSVDKGGEEGDLVYAQVQKKEKGGKATPKEPKHPPPRQPTLKMKESEANGNGGQQLNYIEVEFTSPPPPRSADSSTTYTDVVHEGGRLLLMR